MNNITFRLKPANKLNAADLEQSPIWAGYYEPDDVEAIVEWGIPRPVVLAALDAAGWEDDHYFPLPLEAVDSDWMRGKLFGVNVVTANGSRLSGWVWEGTRELVNVFVDSDSYVLTADTPYECDRLVAKLDEGAIFPLQVENRVTKEIWVYPEQ